MGDQALDSVFSLVEDFDHLRFYVDNALASATYFVARYGFQPIAFRGLETGERTSTSHVVQQGQIFLVFTSPLVSNDKLGIGEFLRLHGPGVRDVAFRVSDARKSYSEAIKNGAVSVQEPITTEDSFGKVTIAQIKAFGDVIHSFIERKDYSGAFLPGYSPVTKPDPLANITPSPGFTRIDHIVGNFHENCMEDAVNWYIKTLGFKRLYSYSNANKGKSAFRTIVVTNPNGNVKLPLVEPLPGEKRSQNQEFIDFNGGPGVQHIAFGTSNIVNSVTYLKQRGVSFQEVPSAYYPAIAAKLARDKPGIISQQQLSDMENLKILIDYDSKGHLFQIFAQNIQDKPTTFIELIQRNNHEGFGEGNIQTLFECVEKEQEKREQGSHDHIETL